MHHLYSEIEREIESLKDRIIPSETREARIKKTALALQAGERVPDPLFDEVYPLEIQQLSRIHWTPVQVAMRAAELLVSDESSRVLDIGSGCGKFCTVAALSGAGEFVGIEQRPVLAEIARQASLELGAQQASFIDGNMEDLDWSLFDAFYLFNPFYEHQEKSIRMDETIPWSLETYFRYIEVVRNKLRSARTGAKVATYHGFGGLMPLGYHRVRNETIGSGCLEVWIKRI